MAPVEVGASRRDRARPLLTPLRGLALAVAFSPALLDLGRQVATEPWARAVLVVPWLLLLAARVDRPQDAPRHGRSIVIACLASALLLQVVAIGGDALRLARGGVVIAFAGTLWASGTVGPRAAILSLWLLPVPSFVVDAMSPALEISFGRLLAALPDLAFEATAFDPALSIRGGRLSLEPIDGGLSLCAGLAGIGWARGVFAGRPMRRVVGGALLWGGLGLVVQAALLAVAAVAVAPVAGAAMARGVLDHGGALLIVLVGVALAPIGSASRRRLSGGPGPC